MIVFSSLMFGYYFVFLKDKTFHHYNRFYLLSIVVVSIFLPLIKVEYFTIEVNPDIYLLLNQFNVVQPQNATSNDFNVFSLVFPIVGLVSVFFILKFLGGILKIQTLKKKYPKTKFEGIHFYETALEDAPFSFFKNLFWKDSIPLQSDLGRQILKHEMVHIEQKHTWDKILISTVQSLFWFNPIFYFLKKEISLIHEYLADKKAIEKSDTKAFAAMLLGSHFIGNTLPATSPFLSSNLKKRLIMLKKSHTKYSYARKILALPLVFAIGFAFLVNAKNREISATNVEIAEAVSQIKNDTIRTEATAVLVNDSGESFADKVNLSNEKTRFSIGEKSVSKSEYLKYYFENKDNENLGFSVEYYAGTEVPKYFGVIDLNDKENVAYGRAYDEKLDVEISSVGKVKKNYVVGSAIYSDDDTKNPIISEAEKAKETDYFLVNGIKASKAEYLKFIIDYYKKKGYVFSHALIGKDSKTPIFTAYSDKKQKANLKATSELFSKILKNKEKNKFETTSGNFSATATLVEDDYDNQYDEDTANVIDFQENLQKKVGKNVVVENVAIARNFPDGKNYKIEVKGDKITMNPTLSNKYDKIYINGKLSTQADLDKIDRKKIKSENIKNNNNNGETYNEIKIRTRR
jgi:hypothetical protein